METDPVGWEEEMGVLERGVSVTPKAKLWLS